MAEADVYVNKILTLRVDENPTTGYMWIVNDFDKDDHVLQLTEDFYTADDAPEEWDGVGGTRTLKYMAASAGY